MVTMNTSAPYLQVSMVNTFKEPVVNTLEVSIKDLSKNDLKTLKEEDPFMYYSLPGVRIATMFEQDGEPCHGSPSSTLTYELSSDSPRRSDDTKVVRESRMSFEVDALSLMMELLDDFDDDEEDCALAYIECADTMSSQ